MKNSGILRFILLSQTADGDYRVTEDHHGPAHLGIVEPGHRVAIDEYGTVSLEDTAGMSIPLIEAVSAGKVKVTPGFDHDSLAGFFIAGARHFAWSWILPALAISGEDPDQWTLDGDRDGLALTGPSGQSATYSNRRWWKVKDPEFLEEVTAGMLQDAGVARRFREL